MLREIGVHEIALPLPFELKSVNVHLFPLGDGWMLVDCGLSTPDSFRTLEAALVERGIEWKAIREILLTHTHPDHVGQAKQLLELTGARLSMSSEELKQLQRIYHHDAAWLDDALTLGGVPQGLIDRIQGSFQKMRGQFADLRPDRILQPGDIVETGVGEWRVVITPGHSPGHVCLYSEEHRTMLAGDHILQTITPNIGWMPDRDTLGDFFESLELVKPFELEQLLPGHGVPFEGHRAWADETRQHHEERCALILTSIGGGAKTAHQLVADLWPRELAPFHHRFAVFEVLAHLEYLRRLGKVSEERQDAASLWRV